MKSKVIIFCVLLFCSKFVVSEPLNEELDRQRAYPPSNWQGNQNTAGSGFAQTQNVNSLTNSAQQYENGQEYNVNQGRQHYENHGYNGRPSPLQSLPSKEGPVNFASGANDRRSDGYSSQGNAYPIRTENIPINTGNQQFRQQNWQSQNQGGPTMVHGHEDHLVPQDKYHSVDQVTNIAPAQGAGAGGYQRRLPNTENSNLGQNQLVNVAPAANPQGVGGYPRRFPNIQSMQRGQNQFANIAPAQDSGAGGFRRRFPNGPNAQQRPNQFGAGGQNGPLIPDVFHNQNHYHGPDHHVVYAPPRNQPTYNGNAQNNFPQHYNHPLAPKPANGGFMEYPRPNPGPGVGSIPYENFNDAHAHSTIIKEQEFSGNSPASSSSGPNNPVPNSFNGPIVPINIAPENTGNTGYVENPVLNSRPVEQPPPNNYIAPIVPIEPIDKSDYSGYEEIPMINSESKPVPVGDYYGAPLVPLDSVSPNTGPLNSNAYNGAPLDAPPAQSYPLSGTAPPQGDNALTNINNHFSTVTERGNIDDLFETVRIKDILSQHKNQFVIIHPNGTVEYIDNLEPATPTNPDPVNVVNNAPGDKPANDNTAPAPLQPTNEYPTNAQSNPNNPYSPSNDNSPSTVVSSPPSDGYNPASGPAPPGSSGNNQSPLLPPNGNANNQPLVPIAPTDNGYNPQLGRPYPNGNNYYQRNPTWGNRYATPPSHLLTHISPDGNHSPNPTPVNDQFFNSSPDKTGSGPPSGPFGPGGNNYNSAPYPLPTTGNNQGPYNPTGGNNNATPPPKLPTRISPGIYTSTTPTTDDEEVQKYIDSILNKNGSGPLGPYGPSGNDRKPNAVPSDGNYGPDNPTGNDGVTSSPKLSTHISPGIYTTSTTTTTPTPDELIEEFIDSLNDNTAPSAPPTGSDNKPSGNDNTASSSSASSSSSSPDSSASAASSSSSSGSPKDSSDDKTTTGSATDNVKDGSSSSSTNQATPVNNKYDKGNNSTQAPSGSNNDDVDDIVIDILTKKNSTSHDDDTTITITDNSKHNSSGDDDTDDDETLIISLDTKKNSTSNASSGAGSTASGNSGNDSTANDDGGDKVKNLVIDMMNSVTVWNKTTDKDLFQQLGSSDNSTVNVLYLIQVMSSNKQIVEKNKDTTIYPNGTVVEVFTETIWESKDDPSPTVTRTEKISHRDHKPQ
ncbi:uncharacterized protein LOC142972833 isoform X2 [Anticarsia gemmatalis]|uniref:uncharacterized protein LOC142972833 isoform X2 n=1 Tax=Anticarsia gemmatalis TaxID=129554 RepID=UPI003F76E196